MALWAKVFRLWTTTPRLQNLDAHCIGKPASEIAGGFLPLFAIAPTHGGGECDSFDVYSVSPIDRRCAGANDGDTR
jgi:hypothetical protein